VEPGVQRYFFACYFRRNLYFNLTKILKISELKITLQQAAGNLPRKEFNQSIIRSLTPQQAAGNALAIAVHEADGIIHQ